MRKSNPVALGVIAAAVYAMCCAMAFGQQAGTASTQSGATAGAPDKSRVAPGGEQAKEPRNNNDAINAGIMMQRSGGSLLRATLSSQPDPQQAKLSHVSFFAVPEPQPKTVKAHDLITIIIREQSEFQSNGTTDLKRLA